MAHKFLARRAGLIVNSLRKYGSSKFINVTLCEQSGIATVAMQKSPVNSLTYDFLKELEGVLDGLKTNKAKGMILTSSLNTVFTGGLDILDMYKPNIDIARAVWTALQDVWIKLFSSPYPTVAAINGHSPAGGCVLSLSCEYRVMVNNYTIGLNEAKLGLVAPFWAISNMIYTIGARESELALPCGKRYTTEEAYKVRLIDEIAINKDDALTKAKSFFERFNGVHPVARALTKHELRGKLVEELQQRREEDVETFIAHIQQPAVQKTIEIYLQNLKKK